MYLFLNLAIAYREFEPTYLSFVIRSEFEGPAKAVCGLHDYSGVVVLKRERSEHAVDRDRLIQMAAPSTAVRYTCSWLQVDLRSWVISACS